MLITPAAMVGILLRPLLAILYLLAGWLPRSTGRWVFGSWSGHRYGDNAAALFEHITGTGDAVSVIWISRESAIIRDLRARGFKAHLAWSPRGIWACATAGVYAFDGLTKDVNHWLSRGAFRVLLRHGVGIKRIERGIRNPGHRLHQLFYGNAVQRLFWSIVLPWHRVRPDLVIASSAEHGRQGQLYYGVGAERIAVTGLPRNDQVLDPGPPGWDPDTAAWVTRARQAGRKVWLYLPTFRDSDALPVSWDRLAAAARNGNVSLLVKLHYVDAARHPNLRIGGDDTLRLLDPTLNPNRVFSQVDGLISDYSSVTYDFLLTHMPVIFFVPDLDQFRQDRGLWCDFAEVTPGPVVETIGALGEALAKLGRCPPGGPDEQYRRVLGRFHQFSDTGACERVYREIRSRVSADARVSVASTLHQSPP